MNSECIYCGKNTAKHIKNLPFHGLVDETQISFRGPGWQCTACSEIWTTAADLAEHDQLKADAFRKKVGLMQAKEMEQVREELGLTKLAFCEMLQIPRMTYDRWLKGLVQGEAMDQAVRAKLDPTVAAINNLNLVWIELSKKMGKFRGNIEPQLEKLKELIMYFLKKKGDAKLGKLYLNKLVWYVDQFSFNRSEVGVTGTVYLALQHGPIISSYDQVFRVMRLQGLIRENGENDYTISKEVEFVRLNERELKIADYVWDQWKNRLTQLPKKSHDEAGWKNTEGLECISYSLSRPLVHLKEIDL